MLLANKEGIIRAGPVVTLTAAGVANATTVFTIPTGLIATKSVKIRKVHLFNNLAGNDSILIGTGVGATFAALLPALFSANGLEDIYDNLPEVESFANITAYPAALPLGNSISIQLEVVIIG